MRRDTGGAERAGVAERSDYFFAIRDALATYAASFDVEPTPEELDTLAQGIETDSLKAAEAFFQAEAGTPAPSDALVNAVRTARDAGIQAAKVKMLLGLKIV